MKDFTLQSYKSYLHAIKGNYEHVLRFRDFLTLTDETRPDSFCLIRHDVDRKVKNALRIAELENEMGISSTYYFRIKPSVFNPEIIKKIENLGHEIGYHYENLSDTNGDMEKARIDFSKNLIKLRQFSNIQSISMHGKPLSKFDNRDIWRFDNAKETLLNEYQILGEIYLHIDYSGIAYIGDTGRNWDSTASNLRDKVKSDVDLKIKNGKDLLEMLKHDAPKKMVFQIHPERWTDNKTEYQIQRMKDTAINLVKSFL